MYARSAPLHNRGMRLHATSLDGSSVPSRPRPLRVMAASEQAVRANALGLLLSTCPQIDMVGTSVGVEDARSAALRLRPDVVVVSVAVDGLTRFRRVFDLQLDIPEMGFVMVLADRSGASVRQPPVNRAVLVLPAEFSLADLVSSVIDVASIGCRVNDPQDLRVPVGS
jgi:hypothetical protein